MAEPEIQEDSEENSEGSKLLNSWKNKMLEKFNLPDNFQINIDVPLPALKTEIGNAFEVSDGANKNKAYALILPNTTPIRFETIQRLKECYNQNLCNIMDYGFSDAGAGKYGSYVVIVERPLGKTLAEHVKEMVDNGNFPYGGSPDATFSESFITNEIIEPLNEILKLFEEKGISHGAINQDNIYLQELLPGKAKMMLKESISEPCGYSQFFQYETIERAQAVKLGKGESDISADYFALGCLIYYALFGETPGGENAGEKIGFVSNRLAKGSYNIYLKDKNTSQRMTDLLRGLLNDSVEERWGYEQVYQWIKGKRFNLIRPNFKKEALRSYDFLKGQHATRKALAHAFYKEWDEASTEIRTGKIVKWLELSVSQPQLGGEIETLINSTGGENSKSKRDNDELVAKTIILLDPDGPIRFRNIVTHIDGLGVLMSNAWNSQSHGELQTLTEILRLNLADYKAMRDVDSEEVMDRWIMQKIHAFINMNAYGFGFERCIYDLNRGLPCQSQLMKDKFIVDIKQLLYFLNDNASKLSSYDPVDKHIAAFIASRMDLGKEIRLGVRIEMMDKKSRDRLTKLALLGMGQKKAGIAKLTGLAGWVMKDLSSIVDKVHGKRNREDFKKELERVAKMGDLPAMMDVIANSGIIPRDQDEFAGAKQEYLLLTNELANIAKLKNLAMRHNSYFYSGLFIAKVIAIIIFVVVMVVKMM